MVRATHKRPHVLYFVLSVCVRVHICACLRVSASMCLSVFACCVCLHVCMRACVFLTLAGHDLNGLMHYSNCNVDGLHFPLMAVSACVCLYSHECDARACVCC